MTMGALTSPVRTSSLKASPALSRSPWPSQQMRAGRPWNAIRSWAPRIHLCSRSLSGNRSRTALSVAAMSLGSPESAEQRADVGRDEPGELERAVVAALTGLVADAVAVVEDLGAGVLELDHRLHVPGHRLAGAVGELLRLLVRVLVPVAELDALGQVGQRVVRRGLVGDDVDRHPAAQQLGEHLRGVAHDADGPGATLVLGGDGLVDRLVERVGDLVEVAVLDPAAQPGLVDVDDEAGALVHRDGQRLGAAH